MSIAVAIRDAISMTKKPTFQVVASGGQSAAAQQKQTPLSHPSPASIFDPLAGESPEYRREREQLYQELFPGDPERARRLGAEYERLQLTIHAVMLSLGGEETKLMQAAVRHLIPILSGRSVRSAAPIPRAPMLWANRDKSRKQNPAQFTRAIYQRWIGNGITRKQLRDLDPQLYHALSVWEHRHPEDTIVELPTLAQIIDQRIESLADEFTSDELRRLGSTLQTRHRRSKK